MLGGLINHSLIPRKCLFKMPFIAILKEQDVHFQYLTIPLYFGVFPTHKAGMAAVPLSPTLASSHNKLIMLTILAAKTYVSDLQNVIYKQNLKKKYVSVSILKNSTSLTVLKGFENLLVSVGARRELRRERQNLGMHIQNENLCFLSHHTKDGGPTMTSEYTRVN